MAPDAEGFASRIGIEHGNPAPMATPSQEGSYDIVYVRYETGEVLARQPIEVTPMRASVSAPATGVTGGSVLVNWQGRGTETDFTGIAPKAEGVATTSFYFETKGPDDRAARAIGVAPKRDRSNPIPCLLGAAVVAFF